jgi:hypothetical protein
MSPEIDSRHNTSSAGGINTFHAPAAPAPAALLACFAGARYANFSQITGRFNPKLWLFCRTTDRIAEKQESHLR